MPVTMTGVEILALIKAADAIITGIMAFIRSIRTEDEAVIAAKNALINRIKVLPDLPVDEADER